MLGRCCRAEDGGRAAELRGRPVGRRGVGGRPIAVLVRGGDGGLGWRGSGALGEPADEDGAEVVLRHDRGPRHVGWRERRRELLEEHVCVERSTVRGAVRAAEDLGELALV